MQHNRPMAMEVRDETLYLTTTGEGAPGPVKIGHIKWPHASRAWALYRHLCDECPEAMEAIVQTYLRGVLDGQMLAAEATIREEIDKVLGR